MSQVSHFGHKCHKIILSSCLCRVSDDIIKNTQKTPQKTGFEEEKSFDREYKSFSMETTTKKSILEGNAPLYTVRECQRSVTSFGGAFQCSVPHSEGALAFFERIFGLLREIREESLHIWSWLDSDLRSRLDLREDPQLKEKNPQLIPRIS
jgi:hypothetical protein